MTESINDSENVPETTDDGKSRRDFLKVSTVAGVTAAALIAGGGLLPKLSSAAETATTVSPASPRSLAAAMSSGLKTGDLNILIAAEIAEALAVTTYTNIIDHTPFFFGLPSDDQGYLKAARQEEMSHYLLEQSVTTEPSPYTAFYYPKGMFEDTQTTLNTLVTLEDAFIAAYLVGVRDFSTIDLKLTSARIMGIESDHRTLARVVGPDVAPKNGGPINYITGIQGVSESCAPPNNNGYERTLCWTQISQAVDALTPFVSESAAAAAGFDTKKTFAFDSFTPTLPNPLGAFFSYSGCSSD